MAIATHGGVTRAAEHLCLSQPAVSHKIKRLETVLDCKILARRSNGPLLTEAGSKLLDYAQRMMDLHDEAMAALGKKPVTGSIRLGMTEDTTAGDVARILGRFTRVYPDIQVKTRISQSLRLTEWLDAGEIDIAVMQIFSRDLQKDDLLLFEDRLHWIKAHDFRIQANCKVPFLAFDRNCIYKSWAQTEGGQNGHVFETVMECPSASGILASVQAGLGVALMNELHLSPEVDIVDAGFPEPPSISYIARTRPIMRNDAVRALVQEISQHVKSSAALRIA